MTDILDAKGEALPKKPVRLEPLHDLVLLRPIKRNKTASGRLVLPQTARDPLPISQVVAVGPGRYTMEGDLVPLSVEPGDIVIVAHDQPDKIVDLVVNGEVMALFPEGLIRSKVHNEDLTLCQVGVTIEDIEKEMAAVSEQREAEEAEAKGKLLDMRRQLRNKAKGKRRKR